MMLNDNWFVLLLDSHRCLQNGVSLYIILLLHSEVTMLAISTILCGLRCEYFYRK